MKQLTLQLPTRLHDQLCELAKIADRTPEALALAEIRHRVEQAFEERSVDMLLTDFEYRTKDAAIRVARAASDWAARHKRIGMYHIEASESGKYGVYEMNFDLHATDSPSVGKDDDEGEQWKQSR